MLQRCAAMGVNAKGGELLGGDDGRELRVEMIAPLPAKTFVWWALIEDGSVTKPVVMPERAAAV